MATTSSGATTTAGARSRSEFTAESVQARMRRGAQMLEEQERLTEEADQKARERADALTKAFLEGDIDQLDILEANLESANKAAMTTTRDIAQVIFGVNCELEKMGDEYEQVTSYDAKEKALPESAEAFVRKCEAELRAADDGLVTAEKTTTFMGIGQTSARERAVVAAKEAQARAKEKLESAKASVLVAKAEADKMRRARLETMKFDESMQYRKQLNRRIVEISSARLEHINENVKLNIQRELELQEEVKQYAHEIEEAKARLDETQAAVTSMRDQLNELEENSSAWIALQAEIHKKEDEVRQIESAHNKALRLRTKGQSYLQQHRQQKDAHQAAREFHESSIASMQMADKETERIHASYQELLKARADAEAMAQQDTIERKLGLKIAMNSAQIGAALRRTNLEALEALPAELMELQQIEQADAKSRANARASVAKLADKLTKFLGQHARNDDILQYMPESDKAEGAQQ